MSNLVVPTQRRIHNFLIEFGWTEEESHDAESMINQGFFWSEKYKRYIRKDSMLYEEKDNEIVEYLKHLNENH